MSTQISIWRALAQTILNSQGSMLMANWMEKNTHMLDEKIIGVNQ